MPLLSQEVLDVLWWPSHRSIRTSRSAVAKSATSKRESEGHELLSETCTNYCGKGCIRNSKSVEGRNSKEEARLQEETRGIETAGFLRKNQVADKERSTFDEG